MAVLSSFPDPSLGLLLGQGEGQDHVISLSQSERGAQGEGRGEDLEEAEMRQR